MVPVNEINGGSIVEENMETHRFSGFCEFAFIALGLLQFVLLTQVSLLH